MFKQCKIPGNSVRMQALSINSAKSLVTVLEQCKNRTIGNNIHVTCTPIQGSDRENICIPKMSYDNRLCKHVGYPYIYMAGPLLSTMYCYIKCTECKWLTFPIMLV